MADQSVVRPAPMPTSEENKAKINRYYTKQQDFIIQLADRWEDEKKYEDIADYGKAIQKHMPNGFKLTAMRKSPFGFEFNIGTDAKYLISVKGNKYEWKRV